MAFKLTKNPIFTAKVTVIRPNDKAGFDRSSFVAKYRRTNVDESIELQKYTPREVMERVLVGWEDFLDEDNNPVEFCDATLWAILSEPPALLALNETFWSTIAKAREKN